MVTVMTALCAVLQIFPCQKCQIEYISIISIIHHLAIDTELVSDLDAFQPQKYTVSKKK